MLLDLPACRVEPATQVKKMPDEVGTRGVNSSIIIPSTSNGTKQRTRSILDRIPPNRRRDPNESQRAYEPLLTFSSWTISFVRKGYRTGVNRRPLSGVVSADDLRPFDEPPLLAFFSLPFDRFAAHGDLASPAQSGPLDFRRESYGAPFVADRRAPGDGLFDFVAFFWPVPCFAFGARFCCFAARGDILCILVWICVQYRTGWSFSLFCWKAQRSVEKRPGLRQLWLAGIKGS